MSSADGIRARLYLHAVLPALAELHDLRADWRAATADWDWTVVMGVPGSWATSIRFDHGRATASPRVDHRAGTFRIWLASPGQVQALFTGKGLVVPLPWGHPFHAGRVRLFSSWAEEMGRLFKNKPGRDDPGREERARLLFRVLLRGAGVVGEDDDGMRGAVAAGPQGRVVFRVGKEPLGSVRLSAGGVETGTGLEADWQARVTFADGDVLARAVDEELDALAAAGSGRMRVEGLAPLADMAGLVMERAGAYLRPA
jgi:hypothetical protein